MAAVPVFVAFGGFVLFQVLNSNENSPKPGTVEFHDDFSSDAFKWSKGFVAHSESHFAFGSYEMSTDKGHTFLSTTNAGGRTLLPNVQIDVDAVMSSGNGAIGLVCRSSNDLGYVLMATRSGRFTASQQGVGLMTVLGKGTFDPRLLQGGTAHLEGICKGGSVAHPVTLELFVNGTLVGRAHDNENALQEGQPGLAVGGITGPFTVRFDNFVVRVA